MRERGLRFLAFSLLWLAVGPPGAVDSAHGAGLDGRWLLTIEDDARRIEAPVDLRIDGSGRARMVLLGRTEGDAGLFLGGLEANHLTVAGRMAGDKATFNLVLNGDRLMGRVAGDLLQAEVYGTRVAVAEPEVPVSRYEALLGAVLNGLTQNFYDPKLHGLTEGALRARYLPKVKAARNDGELVIAIRQMLAELRTSHAEFFLAADKPQVVHKSEAAIWRQIDETIGYLALPYLPGERLRDFDGLLNLAMTEMEKRPVLILDLRGNRGGAIEPALAALNLLLPERRRVAYFATRDALRRLRVESIDQLDPAVLPVADADDQAATAKFQGAGVYQAGGKFRAPYRGRIAVLIDERCADGCELLAAALRESGAATLIGRRTRGSLLLSTSVRFTIIGWAGFPRNQVRGWQLEAPIAEVRTAARRRIESLGLDPDLPVDRSSTEDADLARALNWARK
ncbi:MAG: S41 family peptidase [Blastocatellia bacterium]